MTKEVFNPAELKQFRQLQADLNVQGSEERVLVINAWQQPERRAYLEAYSLSQSGLNHSLNLDNTGDLQSLKLAWRAQDANNLRYFNENEIVGLTEMLCRHGEQRNQLQAEIARIGGMADIAIKQIPYAKVAYNILGLELGADARPRFQGLTREYLERFNSSTLNNSLPTLMSSRHVSFSQSGFQHVFGGWLKQHNIKEAQHAEYLSQFQQLTHERLGGMRAELLKLTDEQRQIREKLEGLFNLLGQTKDVHALFKAYGLGQCKVDVDNQLKLNGLIHAFKKAEQAQMIQEEKARFLQRFEDANAVFVGIGQIGKQLGNRNLETVGSIGSRSIAIVREFSKIGGFIPGMAAPTGIGLLLSGANLAVTTASLLFSLFSRHDKGPTQLDAIQKALKNISLQIGELREEMRGRFDQVDRQLQEIYKKMIQEFTRVEAVFTYTVSVLQSVIKIGHKNIESDIGNSQKLNESLHIKNVIDRFKKVSNRIKHHIQNENTKADELVRDLIDSELYLKDTFCDPRFNQSLRYETDTVQKDSYRHIAKFVKEMQDKDVSLILGYLACYARDRVGISEIKDVNLPNLDVWSHGVEQTLVARTCLKQRHHKDASSQDLQEIKSRGMASIQFFDYLITSRTQIFKHLFEVYQEGKSRMEEVVISELVNRENSQPVTTDSLGEPFIIKPIQIESSDPNLNSQSLNNKIRESKMAIPELLIRAQQLGVGRWEASYQASITSGDWSLWTTGHSHYHATIAPGNISGSVNLNFITSDSETEVKIVSGSFSKQIGVKWSDKSKGRHRHGRERDTHNRLVPEYNIRRAEQQSISSQKLPEYFDNSTISLKLEDDIASVSEKLFPKGLISKLWDDAKADTIHGNFKEKIQSLKGLDKFEDSLSQMQAARGLALLYGKLLGFTPALMLQINDVFEVDLDKLLDNPSLFNCTINGEEFSNAIALSYQLNNGFVNDQKDHPSSLNPKSSAAMKHRVGDSKVGYIRHAVLGDGDCGYTAFGITRKGALGLLQSNIISISVRDRLQVAVRGALVTTEFFNYLKEQKEFSDLKHENILHDLDKFSRELNIIHRYLEYDIRDRRVDAGWAHPSVLQALADIRGIQLNMWHLDSHEEPVPHSGPGYDFSEYKPVNATRRTDLLFVNGNHFDRLEFGDSPVQDASSSVRQRFINVLEQMELFEKYVLGLGHVFDPDSVANQAVKGIYIPWQQIDKGKEIKNGEGGFGVVYKGLLISSKKAIAIKEMKAANKESFIHEVELCSTIKSKYVIPIYGYSQSKGKNYLIMELAERSLAELIHDQKKEISDTQKVQMAMGVARGLAFLHKKQILHGDIKSFNILLDEALNTKIADFGLAKAKKKTERAALTGRTSSNQIKHSLLWRAPETFQKGCQPNFQSDVYSFGVVLWEIFSRQEPFAEEDIPQIIDIIKGVRADSEKIPSHTPDVFKAIIRDCWKNDPTKRPSMQEILQRMEHAYPEICKTLGDDENFAASSPVGGATLPAEDKFSSLISQGVFAPSSRALLTNTAIIETQLRQLNLTLEYATLLMMGADAATLAAKRQSLTFVDKSTLEYLITQERDQKQSIDIEEPGYVAVWLAKEQLRDHAKDKWGLIAYDVAPDGNCFFHALFDQLQKRPIQVNHEIKSHEDLRQIACNHIVTYWKDRYQNFVAGDANVFIDQMLKNGEWAENIVIDALAHALNCVIVIIRHDGSEPNIIKPTQAASSRVLTLGYEVGLHYQSLRGDINAELQGKVTAKPVAQQQAISQPPVLR